MSFNKSFNQRPFNVTSTSTPPIIDGLFIATTKLYPLAYTVNFKDIMGGRSTFGFQIMSPTALHTGQDIKYYEDDVKIFGGQIDTFKKSYLRGKDRETSRRKYTVRGIDYNQICDRIRVAKTYVDETLGDIIDDLFDTYLTAENILKGTISESSTVIKQAVFNYITMTQALDFLRDAIGGSLNWNIDSHLTFTIYKRADGLGAELNDENVQMFEQEETRRDYRNKVLVRAGDGTTEEQEGEAPSPKPDGESRTFVFRFPLATEPTIEIDTGSGYVAIPSADVGINGVEPNKRWYWSKGSRQITQDPAEAILSNTDLIRGDYKGLKPIIVQVEDSAEQSARALIENGTGIYQSIENKLEMDDKQAVRDYATGVLTRYGVIPSTIIASTYERRVVGQVIPINSQQLEIQADYLLTECSGQDVDGKGKLLYTMTLVSGEDLGTWMDYFNNLRNATDITIRENEVLILLQSVNEKSPHAGTINITYRVAGVCSTTLRCGTSLICGGSRSEEVIIND